MPNPVRSRAPSRTQSRAASPTLSVKSRKSMMSSRHMGRNNYVEHELTDDEDSGSDGYVDDFRSLRGRRESSARSTASRRSRRNSTQSSLDLEDDSESFAHANSGRGGSSVRSNRRSGSMARSVQSGWSPAKQTNSASTSRSRDNGLLERNDRTMKNVSDSPMTPDSESEPGTKALVQAKIREKLAQQSSLDESSSDFWKSKPINSKINEQSPSIDKIDNIQPIVAAVEKIDFIDESNPNEPDDSPMGPPPSAPDHEWECEFCTFVNEANIKICTICCKTPKSGPPKPVASTATAGAMTTVTNNNNTETIISVTTNSNKIDEEKNSIPSTKSKTASSSEENSKDTSTTTTGNGKIKGRTRKISFWPGTKSK